MIEPQQGNVPDCFVEAYSAFLVGPDRVDHPTTDDMREVLAYTFELDGEAGWVRATSATGAVYTFNLNVVEHVTAVEPATTVAWLVWLTLMSLAGLNDEMTRNENNRHYVRTFSDGKITLKKRVDGMFFKD